MSHNNTQLDTLLYRCVSEHNTRRCTYIKRLTEGGHWNEDTMFFYPISKLWSLTWRSSHLLHILSRALLPGDQGYYSSSSEACQDHQKLNSFTPFPSSTAYFRSSISQIIIHPKNMQFMERLAFFLLPES